MSRSTRTFYDEKDWIQELLRCGIPNHRSPWHVLKRKVPGKEDGLPKCFVVPSHLDEKKYSDLCRIFRHNRAAVWVWGMENGASLIRLADYLPQTASNTKSVAQTDDILRFEYLRMFANLRLLPRCIELCKFFPTLQDLHQSYIRLRTLCTPISDRELTIQDEKFLVELEKTSWLFYVSLCLKTANECSNYLQDGESVVLQEYEGRDLSCVISSIIQILLDPFYRTINGFQALIQKEWVALGHPFCDRLGHIYEKHAERSPVFLLFLDCVWQILQQFPEAFEYSETFLTTIWDSVFIPIFDTFQFNCEADRVKAVHQDNLVLRPVWDWEEMLNEKDIVLFTNPLYKKPQTIEHEVENVDNSASPLKLPGIEIINRHHQGKRFSLQLSQSVNTIESGFKHLRSSDIMNRSFGSSSSGSMWHHVDSCDKVSNILKVFVLFYGVEKILSAKYQIFYSVDFKKP